MNVFRDQKAVIENKMLEWFKLKTNYIHLFNWEDEQSSCVTVNNTD